MSLAHVGIPCGVHLVLERRARVLLMRRANTGFFDGLLSLPGGHIEPGESVVMAAVREAAEELAIDVPLAKLRISGVMHRLSDTNRVDFFVQVDRWYGEPRRAEADKCSELAWTQREQLPDDVVPYVVTALRCERPEPWLLECGWPESAGPTRA